MREKISEELSSPSIMAATTSTWGERLSMNLFSYSLVLVPIAIVVISTKFKLLPTSIRNSTLVQWFVYGNSPTGADARQTKNSKKDGERLLAANDNDPQVRRSSHARSESNQTLTFVWCFAGLLFFFLVWGYLQEKIMTTKYLAYTGFRNESYPKKQHFGDSNSSDTSQKDIITFHDSQFLVFMNRILAFILSIGALLYNRTRRPQLFSSAKRSAASIYQHQTEEKKSQAPLYEYVFSSLSNILSSWCQYEALKYVNFPTQVLSKSCKIIFVMFMSWLMTRKRYKSFDYLCALLLSLGMFIFLINQPMDIKKHEKKGSLAETLPASQQNQSLTGHLNLTKLSQHVKNNSLISGLIILTLYLVFDSFTSNWEDRLFSRYSVSKWQMMAATNFYSIMLTLTSLHQLGNLKPAFELLAASSSLLMDCILMSIVSSIGQLFIFHTIDRFGAAVFAVIMTLRQFFAILLSCTVYGHSITLGSTVGMALVFLVVGYRLWHRWRQNSQRRSSAATKASGEGSVRIHFKTLNK